jgi:anti-anti-sigma factor
MFWLYACEPLAAHPRSIVIDASRLTFIDSAGLIALWRARDAANAAGVTSRVSGATAPVRRLVGASRVQELLLDT